MELIKKSFHVGTQSVYYGFRNHSYQHSCHKRECSIKHIALNTSQFHNRNNTNFNAQNGLLSSGRCLSTCID